MILFKMCIYIYISLLESRWVGGLGKDGNKDSWQIRSKFERNVLSLLVDGRQNSCYKSCGKDKDSQQVLGRRNRLGAVGHIAHLITIACSVIHLQLWFHILRKKKSQCGHQAQSNYLTTHPDVRKEMEYKSSFGWNEAGMECESWEERCQLYCLII